MDEDPNVPKEGGEQTPETKTPEERLAEKEAELVSLKKKTDELQAQKEHWRKKAERLEGEIPPKEPLSEPSPSDEEELSDEGKRLNQEIVSLRDKVTTLESSMALERLQMKYPVLKDKAEEFEEFLSNPENAGMNLKTAAKAFLVEKELLNVLPARIGLEKSTGGTKVPPPQAGYTVEESKRIRETDPKFYEKLVREGRMKIISS